MGEPPPSGSQPPSGLPIPGEASFGNGSGQQGSPNEALQRLVAAQLQGHGQLAGQLPGSSAAHPASMQRPPAPLFVGQVVINPLIQAFPVKFSGTLDHDRPCYCPL